MKVMKVGTPKEYAEAIKNMLATVNYEELNRANHYALENGLITLEHFKLAAREIAKAIINR